MTTSTNNNRVKFEQVDQINTRYNDDNEEGEPYNNENNYVEEEQEEEEQHQQEYTTNTTQKQEEEIYYFQTKIKNSGFWGKVKLRNGTRLLVVGLVLFVISIVLIGVFWGFWYSHALNYPMRILAITFLVLSITFMIIGLICNYLMLTDPARKQVLGSPFRKETWALIISIVLLVIASYMITLYYTYWHNFYVNTPLIVIAVVFYFFGSIGFIVSLNRICRLWINPDYINIKKEEKQQKKAIASNPEYPIENNGNEQNEQYLDTSQVYSETTESIRKDFRKKQLKLTPRPVIIANDYDTIPETN